MSTESPAGRLQPSADTHQWQAHPAGARAVRLSISGVALGAVVGGTWLVADHLPQWHGWALSARYGVLVVTSVSLSLALDRVARRLLPLAILLELSVTVPDRLPGRFSVSMRAANTRRVSRQLENSELPSTASEAITRAVLMLGALAVHDRRTRGHCERVRALNDLMAEELGLDPDEREKLRWAALLHDIGKLEIPTRILNKPSAPSAKEWRTLRMHPKVGDQMIEPLRPWLGEWADAVIHHHERWDGGGYPYGLAGKEISLAGRIVALVDAYEVLTAVRPYQRPVSPAAARAELVRCAGSHFDPALVRTFLTISIGKLRRAMGPGAWLAQFPLIAVAPRLEVAAAMVARQSMTTVAAATTTGAVAAAVTVAGAAPSSATPAPAPAATTPPSAVALHSHGLGAHSHYSIPTSSEPAPTTRDVHGSGSSGVPHAAGHGGSVPDSSPAPAHGNPPSHSPAAPANRGVGHQPGRRPVQSASNTAPLSTPSIANRGRHLGSRTRLVPPHAVPLPNPSLHHKKGA